MADSTYEKPFLAIEAQIDRLQQRGMTLASRDAARNALRRIGYYRLSGYWYPYRLPVSGENSKRPSQFMPGTTLAGVLDVYAFDEQLRGALLDAIAQVEVALRFELGHRLGKYGPFAHLEDEHFNPGFTKMRARACNIPGCNGDCRWEESDHHEWLDRQKHAEKISTEAFAAHFRENYGEPLPIWVATEVMQLGRLTRLLDGLDSAERELLAAEWDVLDSDGRGDPSALSNWMEHLRQVRNICAHHSRIWNRNINATIAIPDGLPELAHLETGKTDDDYTPPAVRRVYGTFAILTHLLAVIEAPQQYRDRLRTLLAEFIEAQPHSATSMGFPAGWEQEPIAATQYHRDQQRLEQVALLRQSEALGTREAVALLTAVTEPSKRASRLNYYRKNGALLSVLWSARHAYPAFQFDQNTGDVPEVVIHANRRLLDGGQADDQQRWSSLEWWLTPNPDALNGATPEAALRDGALDMNALDQMLSPRDDE